MASTGVEYSEKQRQQLREEIFFALGENLFLDEAKIVAEYKGFKVATPSKMAPDSKRLLLVRKGQYSVPMGDSKQGILVRIDNFLNNLSGYYTSLAESIATMKLRRKSLSQEISSTQNYANKIKELQKQIILLTAFRGIIAVCKQ